MKSVIKLGRKKFDKVLEVTDPCYNAGSYGELMVRNISPGEYLIVCEINEESDGNLITMLALLNTDYFSELTWDDTISAPEWDCLGSIGVDSGLAGFFNDKPDYSQPEWVELTNELYGEKKPNKVKVLLPKELSPLESSVYETQEGVFCNTGIGDGCYPLSTLFKDNDKDSVIGVRLDFEVD